MLKSLNFELKKKKKKKEKKKNGKGYIFIDTTKNIAYDFSRTCAMYV